MKNSTTILNKSTIKNDAHQSTLSDNISQKSALNPPKLVNPISQNNPQVISTDRMNPNNIQPPI
jgi:hypothetical protein